MAVRDADTICTNAQELGVPIARYRTPADVVSGEHEKSRGLFCSLPLGDGYEADVLLAPYQFRFSPLAFSGGVPSLGEMSEEQVHKGQVNNGAGQ
jgi:benzylsuccinate CoA-transferase BbsE subunit